MKPKVTMLKTLIIRKKIVMLSPKAFMNSSKFSLVFSLYFLPKNSSTILKPVLNCFLQLNQVTC